MAKKQEQPNSLQYLKTALKNKELGRLYIFHGEETFLLNHYLNQVKKQLLDPLTESFNYNRLTNETFDMRSFMDAVEAMPMMAEATLVQVDEVDLFKLPEADRAKMGEILSDIPQWCTVIFTYETVAWKPDKRLKKLWDPINTCAEIVEFEKQEQRDLIAWIQRHFSSHKKRIGADLCVYLIDITGGTMTALAGEIEKICAYSGSDEIKRSDIDAVTEPVLDAVAFDMANMLSDGRFTLALEKLQQLMKMQQEPLMILGAIGGHFRKLGTARTLLDNARTASELAALYHIPEYPARKIMEAARRLRPEFCAKASLLILETDYQIKTSFDDPERLLELLILQLAQEAGHG